MDLSLFFFANDSTERDTDRYRLLLDAARFADTHGFTAVWTPERHFHPFGGLYPNPAVTGAAIATVTERIGIRAGSVVSPLHHPLRIAEEWSVVDNLSGGRAGVSFASGWHAADFALRPESYPERRKVLLEDVETVRRLWRGESVPVPDGAGEIRELSVYPPTVRGELPVWITSAGGAETFRNAGRLGAGLLTHLLGQEPEDLRYKISEYRAAAAEVGGTGHVVLMVHTFLADDEETARTAVRDPLSAYIRSSLGLLLGSGLEGRRAVDLDRLPPEEIDFLVARSFDRYVDDGGLLGTVDRAERTVARFAELGVDEIACLVDFGVPGADVLAHLPHLADLRERVASDG